jgi:hypothetical protein
MNHSVLIMPSLWYDLINKHYPNLIQYESFLVNNYKPNHFVKINLYKDKEHMGDMKVKACRINRGSDNMIVMLNKYCYENHIKIVVKKVHN